MMSPMVVTHRLGEATEDVVSELMDGMARHRRRWMLSKSLLLPESWWMLLCHDTRKGCVLLPMLSLSSLLLFIYRCSFFVHITVVAEVAHTWLLGGMVSSTE